MYLVRNYTGELELWEDKPVRHFDDPADKEVCWWEGNHLLLTLNEKDYPEITWETEPVKVTVIPVNEYKKLKNIK